METTFIYALNDPETGECRYVGKADDPHDRLFGDSGHLYDARNASKTYHCANWIRSLLNRGLVPLLEILQEVPETDWELWERAWIKTSREIGMDLTNCTDGGDCGPVMRGEKNPAFGKARRGKDNSFFGKKHTPGAIEKNRLAHLGKKHTPESCAKISAANRLKEKPSEETRAKMRRSQSERRTKEKLNFPNE